MNPDNCNQNQHEYQKTNVVESIFFKIFTILPSFSSHYTQNPFKNIHVLEEDSQNAYWNLKALFIYEPNQLTRCDVTLQYINQLGLNIASILLSFLPFLNCYYFFLKGKRFLSTCLRNLDLRADSLLDCFLLCLFSSLSS